ncbi:MAG TPA: 30S ribosomal protein S12 methylthiotransferase RimO, partial [Desulfobacteraceae bacterium]|nr:30S ribosomal protein S12 methylthiotransferase RimO [Desulfobacteraceae bacterium]
KNICSYYDVPIQHAGSSVLKRMGRHYSQKDLYRIFENIRTRDPEAVLRTTVIVGFPGETDKDMDALMTFIQDIRFDHLGAFIYSDAEDLPSHRLKHHVPKQIAKKRHDRVMKRQRAISLKNNEKYLGKRLTVLTEESPEPGVFIGRTAFQAPEVDGITY